MYRKKFMQAAAVALGFVSLSAFAVQDFSGLGNTELTQLKPSEMGEEDRNAFRAEMQKRSASMTSAEKDETRNQMREQKGKGQGSGGGQGKKGSGGMQGGGGMGRGGH